MGVLNFISDGQAVRNLIVITYDISVHMALYINKVEYAVK